MCERVCWAPLVAIRCRWGKPAFGHGRRARVVHVRSPADTLLVGQRWRALVTVGNPWLRTLAVVALVAQGIEQWFPNLHVNPLRRKGNGRQRDYQRRPSVPSAYRPSLTARHRRRSTRGSHEHSAWCVVTLASQRVPTVPTAAARTRSTRKIDSA